MDGENRGQHDRAVVRALRSLEPLTVPTGIERQRIRDRILLALDAEDAGEPNRGGPQDDPISAPTEPTDSPEPVPQQRVSAEPRPATGDSPATDASPRRRARTRPAATTGHVAATDSPAKRRAGAKAAPSRPGGGRGSTRPDTTDARRRPEARRRGVMAGARGRLAVAALALLALVGSLAGMSVLASRDALPGDALYGVKRTAEAASLGLTFGDEPKALKHLEFAAARVSEIETLARRYPNPADAPVGGYLTALTDFDNDAIAGARQLIALATRGDGRLLDSLRDWSAQQASRLGRVAARLPQAAHNRQNASHALLDRITTRADTLLDRMDCYQMTSGSSDDIGALPATGPCEEGTPAPSSSAQPSVSGTPDIPGQPTGPETPSPGLPSAEPTPIVPPVPVPGATVSVPAPTERPSVPSTSTTNPPLISLPPLLPGLGLG